MTRDSFWAGAWLLLAIAASALLMRYLPVQTDLLALLPSTERSAAAELAVNAIGRAAGNRAVFLVGHDDPASARRAASAFAADLRRGGAFAAVHLEVPDFDPRALSAPHREFRFGLLANDDRSALAGEEFDLEQWLLRRINDPFGPRLGVGLAEDPFGFFDNFLASLPYRQVRLELEDGLLVARPPRSAGLHVLVTADLPGSAFDDAIQRAAVASVVGAERAARAAVPDVRVLRTGAVFFAEAARSSAQRDVEIIAAGSLIGIVLLMLAVFRSLRPLVFGLATVLTGLAAAAGTTVAVYGELHLLTLVFGASLIGEAIDYSIQYFSVYAATSSRWDPNAGMRSVRPALTLALVTSALGYGALLFMPFPAVQQIALFAMSGLVVAYVAVVVVLPRLLAQPSRRDMGPLASLMARFVGGWKAAVTPRVAVAVSALLLVLCVPGWLRLHADDDVRLLSNRPAALLDQEARIRSLTGVDTGTRFFVVQAGSAEAVLQAEERLAERLRALAARGEISHFQAVSSFVPSAARQAENRSLLLKRVHGDGKLLQQAFEHVGLRSGTASELSRAYRESEGRLITSETWLASPVAAPFRHLWLGKGEGGFTSVVVPLGATGSAGLAAAAAGLEGVHFVDKAASVSRLFSQYRSGFSYGVLAALLLVAGLLSRRYGVTGGVAAVVPPILGMAGALALAGYTGTAVTLFTVLALMLVLGVGVNYAIFMIEGRARPGATGIAVLLSAMTTVLSFGLLAFSGMPALAAFGGTLLAGITVAVCATPLALSLVPARGPS